MYLHENLDDFRELVAATSAHFNRATPFIIKDYFAVMMLRELTEADPNLVFKGGTCLSKCYGIIDRFSEDVDLGIEEVHATEGMRKRIKEAVQTSAAKLKLTIPNIDKTRSRREYNRYEMPLPALIPADEPDLLIVETAIMTPTFPAKVRNIQSFIGEYCTASDFDDVIDEYALDVFDVRANSMERTFCDKVFALCDYYLSGTIPPRQSRHIYDLKKLVGVVELNESMLDLMTIVREQRVDHFGCLSASPKVSVPEVLKKIAETDAYKSDYKNLTEPLLYEDLPYEQAIDALNRIASFLEQYKRFS